MAKKQKPGFAGILRGGPGVCAKRGTPRTALIEEKSALAKKQKPGFAGILRGGPGVCAKRNPTDSID